VSFNKKLVIKAGELRDNSSYKKNRSVKAIFQCDECDIQTVTYII